MFCHLDNIFFVQLAAYASRMTNQPPSRSLDRIMIRLPDGMRERLAKAASELGRSVNAEVVARLEKSFEDDSANEALSDAVAEHEERIANLERRMDDVFHMAGWRDYPENQND